MQTAKARHTWKIEQGVCIVNTVDGNLHMLLGTKPLVPLVPLISLVLLINEQWKLFLC